MSNKEIFISTVKELFQKCSDSVPAEALEYLATIDKEKPLFSENGARILEWMQNNYEDYSNVMTAKIIADGLGINSRSVSGSIRKLVTDGYVEKGIGTPIAYSLTDSGKSVGVVYPEADKT